MRKAPWRIGPILALAADRVTTEGPQVVLRRWDAESGAPLPDVKLFEGRPVARLPSADGRHLLISSLPEESSGAWERYLWSIFSLASGELVAEMRHHRSADRFSILGATLLHLSQPFGRRVGDEWVEEPLKLRAVDLNPKEKPGSQGGIHASIRVDPVTGTTVYLGGDRQDTPFPNFMGALNFSGRLFRGDSSVAATGGIYRRTSPTSSGGDWFSINGNLQVTEQHDVAYDAVSDVIISGNQDTGTTQQQTVGGNLTWDSVQTADGGDVAVDDLSAPGVSTRYSSFQFLGAFRRREYDTSNGLLTTAFPTLIPMGMVPLFTNFVTPVELNAIMPASLLNGGCNAVFESFDMGNTIIEIPGLVDADCSPPVMTFPQNAMAYGGFSGGMPDPDTIWVGSGSLVFNRLAPPGSPLFATVSPFPGTTVTDIVLDPTDTSTAYVVDATDVHQTHDAGFTWTALTGNLTDTRLGTAAIDPGPPGRLFVGGRGGVFELALPPPGVAAVGPFVWGELGTGLPNAPVWDLEWDTTEGVLLAGTLGRGAWTLQGNGTCGFPKDLVVRNQKVTATTTFKACNNIVGGPALTVDGTVDFVAGLLIGFGDGTALGGTVSVEIDASLISP